ncbi:MAG: hypothetical protein RBT62_12840 [Spirochaetia bacterium]|nr:hypothetical protein [Spirochaetia bacterium]
MEANARHFVRLFRVELEDLIEDVRQLMERTETRYQRKEITDYVHLANIAFLQRELDSIVKFSGIVDGIDPSIYKGISEIESHLLATSRDFVSRLEDPEAVYVLLKRKLEKVRIYISLDGSVSTPQ